MTPSKQTQNICITFIQRRVNVFAVGPTLYKCFKNVLRLLRCNFNPCMRVARIEATTNRVDYALSWESIFTTLPHH